MIPPSQTENTTPPGTESSDTSAAEAPVPNATAEGNVLDVARLAGLDLVRRGSEYVARCPGPDHVNGDARASLSLNEQKNVFYCQVCRRGGGPDQLRSWLGMPLRLAADDPVAAAFLLSRRLDGTPGLGVSRKAKRTWIHLPYAERDGKILYHKVRCVEVKQFFTDPKGVPPLLFNLPVLNNLSADSAIVITEGEFDALALTKVGIPGVVSVPNGKGTKLTPDMIKPIVGYASFIIATDDDEAGDELGASLATAFGYSRCRRARFGGFKDADDALMAGWTREQFEAAITAAEPMVASSRRRRRVVDAPNVQQPTADGETIVLNVQLGDVLTQTWERLGELGRAESPALFERRDVLARVKPQTGEVDALTPDGMIDYLARNARWIRRFETADGTREVDAYPPAVVARVVLAAARPGLPVLEAVSSVPLFAPDGTLVTKPGYDRKSGIYLLPQSALVIPPIPPNPTDDEVAEARRLITEEMWGEFPFASESDRAHAIAAPLTVFSRLLFVGPTPLMDTEAPKAGSGKGLLDSTMEMIVAPDGRRVFRMTLPDDEEEARKRITAALMTAPSVIRLDNVSSEVRSAALAAVLTLEEWSDRWLGQNRIVTAPNRALWLMTANNPRFSTEISRRTIRIRLDPKVDRPWERTGFRHDPLLSWVRDNLGVLVRSFLILIARWITEGKPPGSRTLGSFEPWARTVGGILAVSGVQGFLANSAELYDRADAEGASWREFVTVWWDRFAGNWKTVRELHGLATQEGVLLNVVGDGGERSQLTRLGNALVGQTDCQFGDLRIVGETDSHTKTKQYRLVKASSGGSSQVGTDSPGRTVGSTTTGTSASGSSAAPAVSSGTLRDLGGGTTDRSRSANTAKHEVVAEPAGPGGTSPDPSAKTEPSMDTSPAAGLTEPTTTSTTGGSAEGTAGYRRVPQDPSPGAVAGAGPLRDLPATKPRGPAADAPLSPTSLDVGTSRPGGDGDVRVVTTPDGLGEVAEVIGAAGGPIGLDVETTGLDARRDRPRLMQIALADGRAFVIDLFRAAPDGSLGPLAAALRRADLVIHNAAFDLSFLRHHFGVEPAAVWDTMLASQVLDGGVNLRVRDYHSLEGVVGRHLDIELDKAMQTSDWSADELSPAQIAYAAMDALVLPPLRTMLEVALEQEGLGETIALENSAVPAIVDIRLNGMQVDIEGWTDLVRLAADETDALATRIKNELGVENADSPQQVLKALKARKIPVVATRKDALAPFLDNPVVALVAAYQGARGFPRGLGRAVLEQLEGDGADGRVRCDVYQIGAPTGRMSSARPNLMAVPKRDGRVRRQFVAAEGYRLVVADYSAIELRTLAQVTGDRRLVAIFNRPPSDDPREARLRDPHWIMASQITGKDVLDVTKEERQRGKCVSFGMPFGMGPDRFVEYALAQFGVRFTRQEAEQARESWRRTFPDVRAWQIDTGKTEPPIMKTIGGRRRRFPDAGKGYTERLNHPAQGTAADGLKAALALLHGRLPAHGARLVMCVHDEVVVEAPAENAEAVRAVVVATMKEGMERFVKVVPVEVEADIRRAWGKEEKQ